MNARGRTQASASLVLVTRLSGAALVEHYAPHARRFAAPDRIEAADDLAVWIADEAGAQRQRAGLQDFHAIGFPRERRGPAFEELRPGGEHFFLAVKHARAIEENGLIGYVGRKCRHVAVGH